MVLELSCAFLNAPLDKVPNAEPVYLQPPSILYKLGLLPKGALWKARKAISGLRRSRKQWELERNEELTGAALLPKEGHELGQLTLHKLESVTWVIRDEKNGFAGALVMYVDDSFIIGGIELCGRVKAKLRELRELKIQGILQNEQLGWLHSGARVTLEGEVKPEVTYLGMQIGRNQKGI